MSAQVTKRPWPERSVHIVRHPSAASALGEREGCTVVVTPDNLAYGPSSLDPREHARLRRRFWSGERRVGPTPDREVSPLLERSAVLGADQLLSLLPPRSPVVLWSASHWLDVLSFWWAMDTLLRLHVASSVWLARSSEVDVPVEATLPRLWEKGVEQAAPLTRQELRAGANMWRRFTAKTPVPVERARRASDTNTQRLLFNYLSLFPVVGRLHDRLGLSLVDQQVFRSLSTERWSGLSHLFIAQRKVTAPVYETFGARFLLARLWRWASWRSGAFIRRRLKPGAETLEHAEYQLTPRGAAMLDGTEPAVTPPLAVGGVSVGGDSAEWGCIETAEGGWRIVRLKNRTSQLP